MARKSKAEAKRKEIVEAFAQCILNVGMDNASMNEVAQIVGLDRSTLHYYFPKRAQLIDDLVENICTSYNKKLKDALAALPIEKKTVHLVDFLFSDKWHDPQNSRLIDEISTYFNRDASVEDPIAKMYRRLEKAQLDIFRKSYLNAPLSEVKEAAYAIIQLVEGSIDFTYYKFPKNRRAAAHKAARRIIESLDTWETI